MGRGKIEIKRIENTSNRQVTYSKRKNGIIKKAKEITVLCDANVSLVIYGSSGKMYEYCSPKTNLIDMLDRYQRLSGNKLWDAKHENLQNEIDRIKKENESMQIELRHLKGEDITSLNYEELIGYEDALENGLTNIREKKDEIPKIMRKREQVLEEENKHLMYLVQQSEMAAMGDYQQHEPFSFRVQPMQPNLHERM
ncbi:putative transcription factor MADS-MIKC family [Helianthus annuus]|uniref:Putative floral homeotic protein PMADS 2 n=11 Tax=Helianthus TaxID=4231 RepID=A0A251VI85_HELAN|nr:floral homeotic protein PMADS 2 [Helianthus annuus]KAF5818352.1 putative transcription factor MADS-MIKC family [Helianthus annuus]KAJ0604651.1 putative transcription factor MADS-MIKC family [Helianthus annuus]KAJ0615196.1 putative transcription factor MADS-MIKC family [Helianthus annuus]KAJ0618667.1 putative transcription factor MADS-MIKC family [Helianthus annuus]KAJ0777120.1 putative transcription factor MADS-MIKC family [Helianthus annuus]